ncbi:hypothetical protein JCM10213v2_008933 [Rhodosporidiobolus nylandii]
MRLGYHGAARPGDLKVALAEGYIRDPCDEIEAVTRLYLLEEGGDLVRIDSDAVWQQYAWPHIVNSKAVAKLLVRQGWEELPEN